MQKKNRLSPQNRNFDSGLNSFKNIRDIECKANSKKLISRKICRNNCKHWDPKKKCLRGYNPKTKGGKNAHNTRSKKR